MALWNQGLDEHADRFAYCAHVCQRGARLYHLRLLR
jgi:hypothetical protein